MASTFTFYNSFKSTISDLSGHTIKLMLATSGYTPAVTHTSYADVSGYEHSSVSTGYTTGGAALVSGVINQTSGTGKLDANDVTWTAGASGITCRYAVLYDDTSDNNDLIAYILLDSSPADIVVPSGSQLEVQWHSSGIYTLT
jgi:hypothetical protein